MKHRPQTNNTVTISPKKRSSHNRKKNRQKFKNRPKNSNFEDDFTVSKSYKNSIKKRLNKNYEEIIQDDDIVFTDNKIYISLARRNSSLASFKKDHRIIYPTSSTHQLSGFLRNYDFNYESPRTTNKLFVDSGAGNLKFDLVKGENCVIFEKVKFPSSDSTIISTTDPDTEEWDNFLKLRMNRTHITTNPSLPTSRLQFQELSKLKNMDEKKESIRRSFDDETFENEFNEIIEKRVSHMGYFI